MYTEDVPEVSRRAFEQLTANGERGVFTRRRHPIVLWGVTLIALGFAAFVLFALVAGSLPASSFLVGLLFLVGDGLWWAYQYLQWRKQWFGVTTKRILFLAGLIDKDIQMMPLSKLTDMTFKKTWIGDILGYGHFIVESAGQKQALERLRFIRNCRAVDMSHEEIRALLGALDRPSADCSPINVLLDGHIAHVDRRISELVRLKEQLTVLRNRCQAENSVETCGILQGLVCMRPETKPRRGSHLG